MCTRLSEWLTKVSQGGVALVGLIAFLLFLALVFPEQTASAADLARQAGMPDTSLFYTREDLYRMAEAYGSLGRAGYIKGSWSFDLIFPLVYTFFLVTSISWLFSKLLPGRSRWGLVNLMPVLGMILDYLENLSVSLVMFRYPEHTLVVDTLAPVFTTVKWVLVGINTGL